MRWEMRWTPTAVTVNNYEHENSVAMVVTLFWILYSISAHIVLPLFFPFKQMLIWKDTPCHIIKKATHWWPFLIGETISTFCSAASQHFAAIGSCHSFTETVFHFTMSFFRLISSKHGFSPFRLARVYYITPFSQKSTVFRSFLFLSNPAILKIKIKKAP